MESKDNIELRSERVRNIIGQVPPLIVRLGITIILVSFIGLIFGLHLVELKDELKISGKIIFYGDQYQVELFVPANEMKRLKQGQTVTIYLSNVENMLDQKIKYQLPKIKNKITIDKKAHVRMTIDVFSNTIETIDGMEIEIKDTLDVIASIDIGKQSVLNKLLLPIKRSLHLNVK